MRTVSEAAATVDDTGRPFAALGLAGGAPLTGRRRRIKGYSRFVSMMKVVLPVVALVLIVLVVVWPHLKVKDTRFRIGFAAIGMTGSNDPSMLNPRYHGTDKDSQSYSITADLAKNLAGTAASVELEMPKADITLEDGTWLVLTANSGLYSRDTKLLDLQGAVTLFHDSGYEFRTSQATVDLDQGIASGTVPVEGQGPFGQLKAEGFRLYKDRKVIVFTGKSRLILNPEFDRKAGP